METMSHTESNKKKSRYIAGGTAIAFLAAAAVFLSWQVGVKYGCDPTPLDLKIQACFFNLRSQWLNSVVTIITHTSDTITIVILCAVLVLSPFPGRKTYGLPVTLASLCGLAVYKPMKHMFLRARPDTALHLVEQGGYSFPSGHSVTSVIVYGLLFYLIQRYCENPVLRKVLSAICLFLAIIVGPTRIYVGVHWPTDVLAGWCIGGAVLLLFLLILERREETWD